jgi:hypothetical protein
MPAAASGYLIKRLSTLSDDGSRCWDSAAKDDTPQQQRLGCGYDGIIDMTAAAHSAQWRL